MCRTAVCYARSLVRKGADKTETKENATAAGEAAVPVVHLAVVVVVVPADMHPKKVTVLKVTGVNLVTLFIF